MIPRISVALPVFSAFGTLRRAVDSLRHQTITDLEILVVLNGTDPATRELAQELGRSDRRIRVLELPEPNLPRAINVALRESRAELVARMDADDSCTPDRLEIQMRAMMERPDLAVLGTAYERRLADGTPRGVVTPPLGAEEIRWRVLIENPMCHGSVMMRRSVVMAAGGYDERCARAQDYELWLRLSRHHRLENLSRVLYTHTSRDSGCVGRPSDQQAIVVAQRMTEAWGQLAETEDTDCRAALASCVAESQLSAAAARRSLSVVERLLGERGPTRSALLAWMFVSSRAVGIGERVPEPCKLGRLREIGERMRTDGVNATWLWGAGEHSRWLLDHVGVFGVGIHGIVDDAVQGQSRLGHTIKGPDLLRRGEHVLLSSDRWEDEMWERSSGLRRRGVIVHRFYGSNVGAGSADAAHGSESVEGEAA